MIQEDEPLILDEDDDNEDDEETEEEEEEEEEEEGEEPIFKAPPFRFDYGFNPLSFLGRFLHRNHPRNIAKRVIAQKEAFDYLRKRAVSPICYLTISHVLHTLMLFLSCPPILGLTGAWQETVGDDHGIASNVSRVILRDYTWSAKWICFNYHSRLVGQSIQARQNEV